MSDYDNDSNVPQAAEQPAPASFDELGSAFGSKTVEQMEEENRQMQRIREEC